MNRYHSKKVSSRLRRLAPALLCLGAVTYSGAVQARGVSAQTAGPQNNVVLPLEAGWMARAVSMYSMGNYQGVADQLREIIDALPASVERTEASLLLARALLAMGDAECCDIASAIRENEGASAYGRQAALIHADWLYFNGQYGPAGLAYAAIPDVQATPQYAYRYAVSLLRAGKFNEARALFSPLTARNSDYSAPAAFYLAWMDYASGNSASALSGFKAVAPWLDAADKASVGNDNEYLPTRLDADYYIAQIDFRYGRYQEAADAAIQLLRRASDTEYRCELNRIAGESLFKLGRMDAAAPYLQQYIALHPAGDTPSPTAAYALGAIYYDQGRYSEAAALLEPVADNTTTVAQSAALLLGQMAAAAGDYSAAALYFEKAWRYGGDEAVRERAMYNHISAMAQGATSPFASATQLPEQFLQRFPSSQYADKVREYLSAAYYRDKDYVRALASLDRIPRPDARQLAARQLVLYELGVSEVSNGDYVSAATHLQQAASGSDRKVAAQAWIWLGQALYAQGKFPQAEEAYRTYLRMEPQGANAAQAVYDAAYALYMQDKFSAAAQEFTRALSMSALPQRLRTDATLRLADCRYYMRDYAAAATLYNEVAGVTDGDAPYAAMRAAMMEGLRGDLQAEIEGLRKMTSSYPDSRWTPAALYELATAQSKNNDIQGAIATYADLAARYGQLEEGRRAQLQIANLYAKSGDDVNAIEAYKTVIRRWPTGEEAKAANVELRELMAARGELTQYAAFMNSVPGAPKVDNAELQRLAYETADSRLIADPADTAPMLQYLSSYPDGLYLAPALWRLAQAYEENGHYDKALEAIERMATARPDARQLPEALIMRGAILEDEYPARAADALASYRKAEQLLGASTPPELYAGIMRLSDNPATTLEYARRLKAMSGLTSEQMQEADFYEAQALAAGGDYTAAYRLYTSLAAQPSSLYGARAAVAYGESLIQRRQYSEAEKILKAFTNEGTPHAYWLARGYIALADACALQGRKALAREYLNALKANYPGSDDDISRRIAESLEKYR